MRLIFYRLIIPQILLYMAQPADHQHATWLYKAHHSQNDSKSHYASSISLFIDNWDTKMVKKGRSYTFPIKSTILIICISMLFLMRSTLQVENFQILHQGPIYNYLCVFFWYQNTWISVFLYIKSQEIPYLRR